MATTQAEQQLKHIDAEEKRLEGKLAALRAIRRELLNKHELNNKTKG